MAEESANLEKLKTREAVEPKEVIPESPSTPEKVTEAVEEKVKEGDESGVPMVSVQAVAPVPKEPKSEKLIKIERILSEDLDDIYFKLPPNKQKEFKTQGEEVAKRIEVLMASVKIKAKEVFKLIKNWLGLVPGVNKFFLEQEAKLRTDKIITLKKLEE